MKSGERSAGRKVPHSKLRSSLNFTLTLIFTATNYAYGGRTATATISGLYDAHERFNRVALAVNGKYTGVDGTWVSIIVLFLALCVCVYGVWPQGPLHICV